MGLFPLLAVTVAAAATVGGVSAAAPSPTAFQPCAAGVPAGVDFNGDRVHDAAVGVPGKTVNGVGEAGMVEIRDVNGRIATLTAARPATNDNFGRALQPADLNGDVCTDLIVGAPFHDVVGDDDCGAVYVFLGTPAGFHEAGLLRPGAGGVPGVPDAFAYFGYALGFGGSQLFVGAPDAAVGGTATILNLSFGATGQVQATGWLLTKDSPRIGGRAEPGDQFGFSFAYFRGQLIVGAPGDGIGGAVYLLGHEGRANVITQDTPGLPGASEPHDEFGSRLYISDDSLVISSPWESIGTVGSAGMVHVIPFDAAILRTEDAVGYSQNSAGVAGAAESADGFGWGLGTSLDGRLLVGASWETVGTVPGSGMVSEIGTGKGWTLNTPGIPGTAAGDDHFGESIGSLGDIPLAGAMGTNGFRGSVIVGLGWPTAKLWTLSGPSNAYQEYGHSLSAPGNPF